MSNAAPALALENIVVALQGDFWQRRKTVLHDISLTVQPGEVFGFVGPNGAGKTTTLRTLLGLCRAQSGQARIFGLAAHLPEARLSVGFVPERNYFPMSLSAVEVVRLQARLAGLRGAAVAAQTTAVLQALGLMESARQRLRTYSKGMLQRLALAQALVSRPRLLVLDEPMSGLDPQGRHEVRELLLAQARKGTTVFFSTHILSDVELICGRVAVLAGGRLRHVGPLSELAGAQSRARVVAAHPPAAAPPTAVQLAEVAEPYGAATAYTCASGAAANAVIDALRAVGHPIVAVQTLQPRLEDFYLRATAAAAPCA